MKVTKAQFVVSAVSKKQFPKEGVPEVVLAGRSNVGKSSLINRLTGEKGLARTSSTPGKTQTINFYRLDGSFLLVDLPGFGWARASKAARRQWRHLVEQYFEDRPEIALVIHLLDARIPPTPLDRELADWLNHLSIPCMLVATKADKLSGNRKVQQERLISTAFGGAPVVLSSAVTGLGCRDIWKRVVEVTCSRARES